MLISREVFAAQGATVGECLEQRGITRREFLGFCGKMAAAFAAIPAIGPLVSATELADKLAAVSTRKPVAVWLQLQECTGCLESTLRAADPGVGALVLDVLSLNYVELLMAASGAAADAALQEANAAPHVLVINGSIPLRFGGAACAIGGKSAQQVLEDSAKNATAILAVGDCAWYGCVQAGRPNPTSCVGVQDIIRNKPVVNVTGCPPIGDIITATIVYYLTYGTTPPLDQQNRPMFAYGQRIHDNCPRRAHFDAGQYVEVFDDENARQGYCLYKMGCKGPDTFSPCPIIQWNSHTAFPISAGHPCLGCTEYHWEDRFSPFYHRLPDVPGVPVESTANTVGTVLVGATVAVIAAHSIITYARRRDEEAEAAAGTTSLEILGDAPPPAELVEAQTEGLPDDPRSVPEQGKE
ncbi:MAG: hydrogenase small subunit [Anaerolineae bacterium]